MTVRRLIILATMLSCAGALIMAGCTIQTTSGSSTSRATSTSMAKRTTTGAPTTTTSANVGAAWGDIQEVGGFEIGAAAPVPDTATSGEPEGAVWSVEVTIKNTTASAQDYNAAEFHLQDSEEYRYDYPLLLIEHWLGTGTLAPGQTVKGRLAFDLPEDAQPAALTYAPILQDVVAVWR